MSDQKKGFISVDVAATIQAGQRVYDSTDVKVGEVAEVDRDTGWIAIETDPLTDDTIYVPFRLVTNIDRRELYLAGSEDELHRDYSERPPRTTEVTPSAGATVATTTQLSGYDGTPMVVKRTDVDEVRKSVQTGDGVRSADGAYLGILKQYDPTTGYMMVERGALSKQDILLPVTVVDRVDREWREVRLVCNRDDLLRMQDLEPVHVVLVPGDAG
jgi:hypothetical protein